MIKNIRYELLLLLVAVFWGLGFPAMKSVIGSYGIFSVLWLRFLLAFLMLLPLCYFKKEFMDVKSMVYGLILGILLFLIFLLFIKGLSLTSSTNTGFLSALAIIWVPLINYVVFKKSIEKLAILSIIIAIIGVCILSSKSLLNINLNKGDAFVIMGSLFSAIHILIIDKISGKVDVLVLITIQFFIAAILFLIMCILSESLILPESWNGDLIVALIVTAVFATVIAFWIQMRYQSKVSPERATIIYNLEPIFSMIFSVVLLHEVLGYNVIFGSLLIFISIFIPILPNLYKQTV
ncbi:DMT family transporter [Stenoxybacter acetivorans]|uniref:DMT family transporter n=1 Tax=Stenoxybacter acetivorans TaxID=422441 RepID=UPI000565FD77|nr:DMT family transporter [Stenoxybacter acetivorans]